jgi:hypothetical protein
MGRPSTVSVRPRTHKSNSHPESTGRPRRRPRDPGRTIRGRGRGESYIGLGHCHLEPPFRAPHRDGSRPDEPQTRAAGAVVQPTPAWGSCPGDYRQNRSSLEARTPKVSPVSGTGTPRFAASLCIRSAASDFWPRESNGRGEMHRYPPCLQSRRDSDGPQWSTSGPHDCGVGRHRGSAKARHTSGPGVTFLGTWRGDEPPSAAAREWGRRKDPACVPLV